MRQLFSYLSFKKALKESLLLLMIIANVIILQAQTSFFTSPGAQSWTCPIGVNSVIIECWGAGGGGSSSPAAGNLKGGGGGGGAYARSIITVVPGQTYNLYVGRGILESDGENSTFNNNTVVAAGGKKGTIGANGNNGIAGLGGAVTNCIGDIKYKGGDGQKIFGGGAAGSNGAGGNASNSAPGLGTAVGGGDGAAASGSGIGLNGNIYGGGGSGANRRNNSGSRGANGRVDITYFCPSFGPVSAGNNQTLNPCVTSATLSASNTPSGMTGAWSLVAGSANILQSNNPNSSIENLVLNSTVTLRWTISNGVCGSASSTVNISAVNGVVPNQPSNIVGNSSVCPNTNYNYQVNSNPGVSYQWSFSGSGSIIGNSNSINLSANSGGNLMVSASNACGSSPSSSISITLNSLSTPVLVSNNSGIVCPNTAIPLTASGGIAGTGSQIYWYDGPNGTGTILGTGVSYTLLASDTMTIYARREGLCNSSDDSPLTVFTKGFRYVSSTTSSNDYCTDVYGWKHWYSGDSIIFSAKGDFSNVSAGYPIVTISTNGGYHQDNDGLYQASDCINGTTPGNELFEMNRSWNLNMGGGATSGSYQVRFYYPVIEKTEIIDAAIDWINAHPACAFGYKYNFPSGFYWFKSNGTPYIAPQWDGSKHNSINANVSGINYDEWLNINGFSGGSGGIILEPNNGTLPIKLLSFSGEKIGLTNLLNWVTATEVNASHFEIQKSVDGVGFDSIGILVAAGESYDPVEYSFEDNKPNSTFNYYRLKMIDKDGEYEYSNVIFLENDLNSIDYAFYPNPTKDIVQYQYKGKIDEDLNIELLDHLGRIIRKQSTIGIEGFNLIPIDLSMLPSGQFWIKINHMISGKISSEKVFKR